MTEQPKEYIITGDEIDEIEKRFNDLIEKGTIPWEEDCLNTLDNIRSHPVSIPPEGAAPDYEHCGNMSSDGEHDCNYRGGHCNFAHTRHCKDFIPCTCEYCDGTVHDAAIRQEAIAEHDWLLRQNRDNLLCFYENPEELKKFKDEIAQEAREEVLPLVKAAQKTQAELFHACWDKNLIDCVKQLGSDLRAIERSLRHPRKGVPE